MDANFKPGTNARILLDSISQHGYRLTTMEVTFHRFVLAEFNTHRVFSRNSASSRAIPFAKQVERVKQHPAIPVSFPAEQRGMSGGEELEDAWGFMESEWLAARDAAVKCAENLANLRVHKSVVNRLLEPFMWHTVIVTATEWDGFFEQRCHKDAQPEIRVAAEAMQQAFNNSIPQPVKFDEWHMPLIDAEDYDAARELAEQDNYHYSTGGVDGRVAVLLRQVSAARCARVSYLTHDGKRSIEADLELYKRLVERDEHNDGPVHWSPLEHVATPASYSEEIAGEVRGNLTGWHQLRHWNMTWI